MRTWRFIVVFLLLNLTWEATQNVGWLLVAAATIVCALISAVADMRDEHRTRDEQ